MAHRRHAPGSGPSDRTGLPDAGRRVSTGTRCLLGCGREVQLHQWGLHHSLLWDPPALLSCRPCTRTFGASDQHATPAAVQAPPTRGLGTAAGFTFSSKTGEDCGAATHRWDGRRWGRQMAGTARSGGGTQWGQHGAGVGARQEDNIRGRRRGWGHVWAHGEEWAPRGQTDMGRADACSGWTQDTQTHTLLAWTAAGAHSDRAGVERPPQMPQHTRSHLPHSRLKHARQFYSRHTGS